MQVFDSLGGIMTPHMQQRLYSLVRQSTLHAVCREQGGVQVCLVVADHARVRACVRGDTADIVFHGLCNDWVWAIDLRLKEHV